MSSGKWRPLCLGLNVLMEYCAISSNGVLLYTINMMLFLGWHLNLKKCWLSYYYGSIGIVNVQEVITKSKQIYKKRVRILANLFC